MSDIRTRRPGSSEGTVMLTKHLSTSVRGGWPGMRALGELVYKALLVLAILFIVSSSSVG
jgi:hypothetical protein